MDHMNKGCSSQNVSKFRQVYFLKKAFQILISIYVFSLFVFQPSLLNAVISYLDHYTSTFSIKLLHYNTERNCIFLLFNGILAVILKNSGLITNSPMNSSHGESRKEKNHHHILEVSEAEISRKKAGNDVKQAGAERGKQNGILVTVEKTTEDISERAIEFTGIAEVESEDEKQSLILSKYGKNEPRMEEVLIEEEEEEEHGLMSVDELNKKCDEFIKKMKEGIKVDFQKVVMI